MKRMNFTRRKEARIKEANARFDQSKDRSPEDQIKRLDARLGVGVGATSERRKLEKKINK